MQNYKTNSMIKFIVTAILTIVLALGFILPASTILSNIQRYEAMTVKAATGQLQVTGIKKSYNLGDTIELPKSTGEIIVKDPKGNKIDPVDASTKYTVVANYAGDYTVEYRDGNTTTGEIVISVKASTPSFNFNTADKKIIPSEIAPNTKVVFPNPEILDEDGEVIEDASATLVVKMANGSVVECQTETDSTSGKQYSYYTFTQEGVYSVVYSYKGQGYNYIDKKYTIEVTEGYESDVDLTFTLDESLPTSLVQGVETTLPTVTGKDKNNNNATVDVYTTVEVEYLNGSLAPDLQIGARAFANCEGLTTVELPENMQTIPDGLFDGCSKLSIVENLPMNPTSIGERAFYGCEKLALDFASPASLNSIGDLAFAGSGITSFDASKIASGVTLATFTLGTNVFASCKDLTTVKFSSQMVNLPEGTFDGCTNLKTLENLPAFVTIGKMAFANCSSLSMELQAPASLTSIGESAFEGSAITSVDTENTKCTFGARAFARCPSLTEFVFPSEIRSLPEYLFTESGLTLIVIPESVTEIGTGCFEDCKSLTNVTYLGKSEISNDIFSGCDNLTVVSVPDDYPYGSFGGHDLGKGGPGLSDAAKIGIGVGVAAAVVIIVVIVVVIVLRRKSGEKPGDDNMVSA